MEKGFLNKVEDNATIWIWSEKTQQDICQNCEISLASILGATVEEYTTLLCFLKIKADKAYSRAANVSTFLKRLMIITGMSEQWDLILAHPDMKKRVDVFALSIYEVTPILVILAETFRSLNACQRAGEGRFIGCAQLLLAWFHNDFWKMAILWSLQDDDVEWRALWMIIDDILYRCKDFDWCEFAYKGDNYKKKVHEISNTWNQTRRMKNFTLNPMTPEFDWWWGKRVNDNVLLGLDVEVEKLEAEKMRKGKNKAEKDWNSLKIYYRKLRLSIRIAGLGKTLVQWRQEIKEENIRADQWGKEFQDARVRADTLERDLLET
ncbi:hypothetical protein Gotur_035571 [Gossypium turneri]